MQKGIYNNQPMAARDIESEEIEAVLKTNHSS